MSGAIGGDRPGRFVGIGDLQIDRVPVIAQPHGARAFQRAGVGPGNVRDVVNALQVRWRRGHHQKCASGQYRVCGESECNVARKTIAADVFPERIRVEQLDVFQNFSVRARRGFIHDLGNGQPGLAARRTQRFPGRHRVATHQGIRYVRQIAEPGTGQPISVVTADRQTEVERIGYGQTGAAQQAPLLAVEAGVTVENVSGALQAQPGLRIVDRKRTQQRRDPTGKSARLKKTSGERRGGQHTDMVAVCVQGFSRHQAGLGPDVRVGQRFHPHGHVKIIRARLVKEMELVR